MNHPTPRLIAVAVTELTPADMEVVCTMKICPSCGTVEKNWEHCHLMCYRCNQVLPPGIRKNIEGWSNQAMLVQFLLELRLLARTHVLLTGRGKEKSLDEAADEVLLLPTSVTPAPARVPSKQHIDIPRPVTARHAPSQRRERPPAEVAWQTIWQEEG